MDDQSAIVSQYRDAFGRDLVQDSQDLDGAKKLADAVGSMMGKGEQEWAKVFADLGSAARFDLWKQALALNTLAGTDETLVHDLSVKGDRVGIAVTDERLRANADAEIGAALAPP